MTPAELQRIGIRIYGRTHWRSQLALNLGVDVSTIWRQSRKEKLSHLMEVAVRGLAEKHRQGLIVSKIVMERLRKEGRLRPKLKRKTKRRKNVDRPQADMDHAVGAGGAVCDEPAADETPAASHRTDV
jgi:hypothetical protein